MVVNKKSFILLYHGVTNSPSPGIENFSQKHIHVSEFEKQIKYISENMKTVSIRDIDKEPGSVAVTFDDTFKNVHDVALPILKKYNVPATFFVTTGFIGNQRRFWVDKLEHMINFAEAPVVSFSDKFYDIGTNEEKINSITEIKALLKRANPSERERGLREIRNQIGYRDDVYVSNYLNLNKQEVKNLDSPPMYEVGGHTVNHEILSYLDSNELEYEVKHCISSLEEILGRKVDLFSYPEGQREHYNSKVIKCLKDNGITVCPSAIDGFVTGEDEFNYKRIMVGFMGREFPVCIR